MQYSAALVLAILPVLALAAPPPEEIASRSKHEIVVRAPSGSFDHYIFSHSEPAERRRRDEAKTPEKQGQDMGKTVIDKIDHKVAHELSGSKVPTPVGNAGKTLADGTAHYADEKLSDEDQGQRRRRSTSGLTVSMYGGHDDGALQRKALYLARV